MLHKSNKPSKSVSNSVTCEEAERHSHEPAITLDQHQIEIAANLGKVQATAQAVECGAEAIGLLRTELVFMSHSSAPNEAVQEADYRVVLDALAGRSTCGTYIRRRW